MASILIEAGMAGFRWYLAAADQGGEGDGGLQGPENGRAPLEGPQKAPSGVSKAPRGPVRSHILSPTSWPPEPPEAPPSPANFSFHSLKRVKC